MFLGTHHHRLDAKGRVTVPRSFRPHLGPEVVVTQGLGGEPCLYLFPLPKWQQIIERLEALPLGRREVRWARRLLMGNAHLVAPDRLGRILIPAPLREAVGIEQDVLIVGLQSFIELWAPEVWHRTRQEVLETGLTEEQWENLGI